MERKIVDSNSRMRRCKFLHQHFDKLNVKSRGEGGSIIELAVEANAANASTPKAKSNKPKINQHCNAGSGQPGGKERDRKFGDIPVCG